MHFRCQGNKSNLVVCIKMICFVEGFAGNISENVCQNISKEMAIMAAVFHSNKVNGNFKLP